MSTSLERWIAEVKYRIDNPPVKLPGRKATTAAAGGMLSDLMAAAAGIQSDRPGLEVPWATLDGWVQDLTTILARLEAVEFTSQARLNNLELHKAECERLTMRLEAAERDDGSLETVSLLASRLYKNVKGLGNERVGHMTLAFTEKDGTRGAVIVLAPDPGNEEIMKAVEAIYDKQGRSPYREE